MKVIRRLSSYRIALALSKILGSCRIENQIYGLQPQNDLEAMHTEAEQGIRLIEEFYESKDSLEKMELAQKAKKVYSCLFARTVDMFYKGQENILLNDSKVGLSNLKHAALLEYECLRLMTKLHRVALERCRQAV